MLKLMEAKHLKLAILVSGRGSNFLSILRAVARGELQARISVVLSDNPAAPALQKARDADIATAVVRPADFAAKAAYEMHIVELLREYDVDLIVLAGYMRIVGTTLLEAYRHRILNIHPALLPAFPGLNAQKQALAYGVRFSGCTVHLVDEGMDSGPIIAQRVTPVLPDDTEATLSERILEQEHQVYPEVLQLLAEGRVYLYGRQIFIRQDDDDLRFKEDFSMDLD
jgi:phosphoribosylglycinamide formyltransferase-1